VDAYITRTSVALPNKAVENDQVEAILGQVGERPSRARRVVLRNNGIRQRYYVIDPGTGLATPTPASPPRRFVASPTKISRWRTSLSWPAAPPTLTS
jgi:hypothetical protein